MRNRFAEQLAIVRNGGSGAVEEDPDEGDIKGPDDEPDEGSEEQ